MCPYLLLLVITTFYRECLKFDVACPCGTKLENMVHYVLLLLHNSSGCTEQSQRTWVLASCCCLLISVVVQRGTNSLRRIYQLSIGFERCLHKVVVQRLYIDVCAVLSARYVLSIEFG